MGPWMANLRPLLGGITAFRFSLQPEGLKKKWEKNSFQVTNTINSSLPLEGDKYGVISQIQKVPAALNPLHTQNTLATEKHFALLSDNSLKCFCP